MKTFGPDEGYADVVIGTQHGDEGKGRFVDGLAERYDWVARYNGGQNAGHTVKANGEEIALNLIPSGVNHPNKKLYIGALCVVNPAGLLDEIRKVEAAGLQVRNRLRISPQASVVQPAHILRDVKSIKGKVGSTGQGIGPAYAWQAMRVEDDRQLDIRMGDIVRNRQWALDMIRKNLVAEMEKLNISGAEFDVEAAMQQLKASLDIIDSLVESNPLLLQEEVRRGAKVLMEGAQAFGLDRTFGVTPNVTSSNTGVAAAFVSTAVDVDFKRQAWGVAKLTPSRVGHGPFAAELGGKRSEEHCMKDGGEYHQKEKEKAIYGDRVAALLASDDPLEVGIAMRILGGEYGAKTGRPRRMGMPDLMQLEYAVKANGLNGIYLTKADRLADFAGTRNGTIPLVTGYRIDNQQINYVPTTNDELSAVQPIVQEVEAFSDDISHVRKDKDLPPQLIDVLRATRDRLGIDIIEVGVGPSREQVVKMNGSLD
jgi:adenylosuccinate synthase